MPAQIHHLQRERQIMAWRKHMDHRAETKAVRLALKAAGLPVGKVTHGRGTAWAWLEVTLIGGTADQRHEAHRIIADVTGRSGDYNGDVLVECNRVGVNIERSDPAFAGELAGKAEARQAERA